MINIGIIGAGYWGPNVVRNFNEIDECRIVRLADLKDGRLAFIREKYPDIELTKNYKEVVDDCSIDAVYIATPVSTHFSIAFEALQVDKHVLLEKPMCQTVEQAEQLVELANKRNKVLSIGHIFQYNSAVQKLKELLAAQAIGDFLYFDSTRINMGPPATEVDVLWDLGPHDLSILFHLLPENPAAVRAIGNSFTWQDRGINDMCYLQIFFDDGKMAHVHLSWLSANKTRLTWIFGSTGSMVYDETKQDKVVVYGQGVDNRVEIKDDQSQKLRYGVGEIFVPEIENYEPLRRECEEFLKAISNGKRTVSRGEIGLKVVKVLEAGSLSMKSNGREVNLSS